VAEVSWTGLAECCVPENLESIFDFGYRAGHGTDQRRELKLPKNQLHAEQYSKTLVGRILQFKSMGRRRVTHAAFS